MAQKNMIRGNTSVISQENDALCSQWKPKGPKLSLGNTLYATRPAHNQLN